MIYLFYHIIANPIVKHSVKAMFYLSAIYSPF